MSDSVVRRFAIEGEMIGLVRHPRGHIHDTYISTWKSSGETQRYLHQRMNANVFRDIPALMHNIERVTRHLGEHDGPGHMEALTLIPTRDGASYLDDATGPWRTYNYIDSTDSFDLCESEELAYEAAKAFGDFQARLLDLDTAVLHETLPRFFSSSFRVEQLDGALAKDPRGRVETAAAELAFVDERRAMTSVIEDAMRAGRIPERVVHGDTKLNNVLFDRKTRRPRAIVDLDTCMPSYSLYDFGDLVRFTAATSDEDERDLSKAGMDIGLYRALVRGYTEAAGSFLSAEELELMPFSARLVTLTIGIRFLTDFIAGDVYFKTTRPTHNLDRARVQFRMVESMERQEAEMTVR